jgi:hypothetical protein
MMKEALSSSEMSAHTRATWRNIPEDAILHSHRREKLKSYKHRDVYTYITCLSRMYAKDKGLNENQ